MKLNPITKVALVAGLVIAIAAFSATRAEAADAVITSSVEVAVLELVVTGVQAVAFGLLAPPDGVADFWTINSCDPGALIGPAGKDIFPLDHSRGEFIITGEPNFTVQYSISVFNNFSSTFLTLTVGAADLCPTSPRAIDPDGTLHPEVGGNLQVDPGIPAGSHFDAVIEMTAIYP
ncbi:MAG: DUF4402 domain-containing protein [candidate division Zixibacteria bacterium]|nr:DUF4402 domain-containing protein [candidate division Zixibacteria bacterium]